MEHTEVAVLAVDSIAKAEAVAASDSRSAQVADMVRRRAIETIEAADNTAVESKANPSLAPMSQFTTLHILPLITCSPRITI